MADRAPQCGIEFGAIQNHFGGIDVLQCRERHNEIAGTLNIDHDLEPPAGTDPAYGPERLVSVMNEDVGSPPEWLPC